MRYLKLILTIVTVSTVAAVSSYTTNFFLGETWQSVPVGESSVTLALAPEKLNTLHILASFCIHIVVLMAILGLYDLRFRTVRADLTKIIAGIITILMFLITIVAIFFYPYTVDNSLTETWFDVFAVLVVFAHFLAIIAAGVMGICYISMLMATTESVGGSWDDKQDAEKALQTLPIVSAVLGLFYIAMMSFVFYMA